MNEEVPIVYQFMGDGSEYHTGIPARNLTANDVALLDAERQLVLSASPLYVPLLPAPAAETEAVPAKARKKGGE